MRMDDITMLVDMGFPKEKAEYALKVTNNKGVEPAMEWLLAHADEDIPAGEANDNQDIAVENTAGNNAASSSTDADGPAKSLKCDDCNKLFNSPDELQYHAIKSGHKSFSESTEEKMPLTEDEKKEQMTILEEKLKQKRGEREEREKKDALERERLRIKSGKDMTEARKRLEEMEMKKLVEQRKRDKIEEKVARDRVRAQIEADKAARKLRGSDGGSPGDSKPVIAAASTTTTATSPTSPIGSGGNTGGTKQPPKEYKETRIQIRLQDGSTLVETFNVKEQLSAVRVFIQVKTGIDIPFGLMTSFPRKVFTIEDFEKPLEILGLVPSAVLIMTKAEA